MTAPDTQNGRVTLGVLSSKMDASLAEHKATNEKLDLIEQVLYERGLEIQEVKGEMHTECARLDGRIDRTEDRVKGWQVAQGGLTIIATTVAAWLGIKL